MKQSQVCLTFRIESEISDKLSASNFLIKIR